MDKTAALELSHEHPIVVFDGVCPFCHFWVRFLFKRDREQCFRFCTAQSPIGQKLLKHFGHDPDDLDSVLLIDQSQCYSKSDAVTGILARLPRPWRWGRFIAFIPRLLRDAVYTLVARHRYRWFGRYDHCPLMSKSQRQRFIDSTEDAP